MSRASFTVFRIHLVSCVVFVPYRPFPYVLSSPSAQSWRPSAFTTSIARGLSNCPSALARWSESGRMADSAQTQVMSPKSPTSSATWIWSTRRSISLTATTISCAQRSIQQQQAKQQLAEFSHCWDNLVSGNSVPVMCRVVLASRKLRQSWTENLLRQRFLVHSLKGKRDRDTNVVHSSRDTQKLQKILERKVDLAVRGEREPQQKLCQAEAEVEVESKNWEKRNSEIAFREINKEFESLRWADQAQRDTISLYGELELTHWLFEEDHARDCQEIEELSRICCEETDQARKDLKNCLCNNRGILRLWVRWWVKFGIYTINWIPRQMQESFTFLNQGASLERPTFLIKLQRFWVPGLCHAAILDCREMHRIVRVLWETFLNDHLFKKDYRLPSSTI